jgi:hypothetical protein
MSLVFRTAIDGDALDIQLLRYRDRAAIRILDRAEAATPRQLAILVYRHLRIAQRRLATLWQAGLLERAILPPRRRAGAELAYRLSRRAQRQLGDYTRRARGSNRLGHTLDIVETVCALVVSHGDPRLGSPVQAWLAEATARSYLGEPPYPDSILVIADGVRSAVLCLEADRATQRLAAIEAKLAAYQHLLDEYPDWQVLFVVPTVARAAWLREVAGEADPSVARRVWVVTLGSLRARHLAAGTTRLHPGQPRTLAALLVPADRKSPTPVGSDAWLQLLGEGGVEELDDVVW